MKFKWQLPPRNIHVSDALLEASGHKHVLAKLLAMRGLTDPDVARRFLNPNLYEPAPPAMLHDLLIGADRIETAIRKQELIFVWGDFDVDGQTSTALLVSALEKLGARVDYHIPVRAEESHGIKPEFLKRYFSKGIGVLLSCDTGIAAKEAVDLANANGIDVVITDHHDLPDDLPNAYASVNPKFHDADHPLYALPGVGVAYKLVEELFNRAERGSELPAFLDLVALGIVADIAQQTKDTRYLLQKGLEILKTTERAGLLSIMKLGNVNASQIIDENIGFQIGPRLNAVGRLGDANVSVPLLTTTDQKLADGIADKLEDMNRDRRYKTAIVYDSAKSQIERDPSLLRFAALVLANPAWHQGVIGIVASRLVEEYGKPTIMLSAPEGELARGSARSIEGYHITEAIASQAEYLVGFGGHPMAAGMALQASDIDRFRRGVSKAIIAQRTGRVPEATLDISLDIQLAQVNHDLMDEVEQLAPFGAGNPPINYLCRNVTVVDDKPFGQDQAHRKLFVSDGVCEPVEIIWWSGAGVSMPEGELDIVFRMRPSYFRGERSLQITLLDLQRADRLRKEKRGLPYQVRDFRTSEHPEKDLLELQAEFPDMQIWGEVGPQIAGMKNRTDLVAADELIVWTLPPDRATFEQVVNRTQPKMIALFGNAPDMDRSDTFIKRLIGLSKYTLTHYGGRISLLKLAAACAQSEAAVTEGLNCLSDIGLAIQVDKKGEVQIVEDTNPEDARMDHAGLENAKSKSSMSGNRLARLLKESAAFRKSLATVPDLVSFLS